MDYRSLLVRYRRRRFGWLFLSLLLTIGVNPILASVLRFNPVEWFLAANLVTAIASAPRERWIRVLQAMVILYVAARGLAAVLGFTAFQPVSQLAWLAAAVLAAAVAARHAVRVRTVDAEHLFAALDAYLLVGLVFGVGYALLDHVSPGSFGERELDLGRGFYFSFVTLATLGYGDVVPVSGPARGFAILEAVAGQMYLAVLVARLVSLYGQKER